MLSEIKIKNVLFLDIETVPCSPSFDDLDTVKKELHVLLEGTISPTIAINIRGNYGIFK